MLNKLGGGCQVPIGAYAVVEDGRLHIMAVVVSPDGKELVRAESAGAVADAAAVGRELGAELLDSGARKILEGVHA